MFEGVCGVGGFGRTGEHGGGQVLECGFELWMILECRNCQVGQLSEGMFEQGFLVFGYVLGLVKVILNVLENARMFLVGFGKLVEKFWILEELNEFQGALGLEGL